MNEVTIIGIDLAKHHFQLHGSPADGSVAFENEGFNGLKRQGYHLEHHFGDGKDTLSSVRVVLNLLAFALHTACDRIETAWRAAHAQAGTRNGLFHTLRVLTRYHLFPAWDDLFTLLTDLTAQPP